MDYNNLHNEAFDNPRRTTDKRTTSAPDFKSPPRRSSYSSDRGIWRNPNFNAPNVAIKPEVPLPKDEPMVSQPTKSSKLKIRQPNIPGFPRIPKIQVPKQPQPKEKKIKSKNRQLSLKLKLRESQVFLNSYYDSLV